MMAVFLKHCPFCGSNEVVVGHNDAGDGDFYVQCWICAATTNYYNTEAEAEEAWNKRFRPPYCSDCKEFDRWYY